MVRIIESKSEKLKIAAEIYWGENVDPQANSQTFDNVKCLAIDPALNNTGWAVIRNEVVLRTGIIAAGKNVKKGVGMSPAEYNFLKCFFTATILNKVIQEHDIELICGELPTGGAKSATAIKSMALATGTITGLAAGTGLNVLWASPSEVKAALTGDNKAKKLTIMLAVAEHFSFPVETPVRCSAVEVTGRYRFEVGTDTYGVGAFEHIADAICAYMACVWRTEMT